VVVTVEELPDGSVVQQAVEPGPCVRCGEVPEQIIRIVEVLFNGPEDGTRLGKPGPPRPA
jgi:hypothetical protein